AGRAGHRAGARGDDWLGLTCASSVPKRRLEGNLAGKCLDQNTREERHYDGERAAVIPTGGIRRTTVGLVLGGGGIRGPACLLGALYGLVAETGWDPATADLLIGTSAGAIVAALTACGV